MNYYQRNGAVYNPTVNPQTDGVQAGTETAATHHRDYFAYGPPPRNFYQERNRKGRHIKNKTLPSVLYADHSIDNTVTSKSRGGSWNHPLSPAGLKESPNIFPEFDDVRPDYPGFFKPPFKYVTGEVLWKHHPGGWQSAMTEALRQKGVTRQGSSELMVEADVKKFYTALTKDAKYKVDATHSLYDPADRDTMIFKDEAAASMTARSAGLGFSLIIVCPYIKADGELYNRMYDMFNRPPVYARYSTGAQGVHEPLVLGCLPVEVMRGTREWYHKDAHWFTMSTKADTPFHKFWTQSFQMIDQKKDMPGLQKLFISYEGLPADVFWWCLVFVHRRIALGLNIPDAQLGNWIWQFGAHMKNCKQPHVPAAFTFDPTKKYTGRTIHYPELTAWIQNRRFSKVTAVYAQRWDDATDALIAYNQDKTAENWTTFKQKLTFAKTPWW